MAKRLLVALFLSAIVLGFAHADDLEDEGEWIRQ